MDTFLGVDSNAGTSSPTLFIRDNSDATSICPLITPSPPTNALVDQLPEPVQVNFQIDEELVEKLQKVHDKSDGGSFSSASSSEQTHQLLIERGDFLNNLPSDDIVDCPIEGGKVTPLELTFRNPTEDYFFTSWNWPLIRKVCSYLYLSILVGMLALVIGLIATIPNTCNPPTKWYQGKLFYEIFPASFYSSKGVMQGDLKGISMKVDYLMNLGVTGVRLNSIFPSADYPKDYENVTTLITIDESLGNVEDLKSLVKHLKSRNMSLILDLPVSSLIQKLFQNNKFHPTSFSVLKNSTNNNNANSDEMSPDFFNFSFDSDPIEAAMQVWMLHGVEGFYLKGLEINATNLEIVKYLTKWKRFIGANKILIVNEKFINNTPKEYLNTVLKSVDLIDVKLDIEQGVEGIIKKINAIQNETFFTELNMPWIHWTIGNSVSKRLANILPFGNGTLGATLLQMMLPGTPSILYGDEISLSEVEFPSNHQDEGGELYNLRQLSMMRWKKESVKALPWIYYRNRNINEDFEQIDAIIKMSNLRNVSPSIYMNAVSKEGITKANAEVKYSEENFLVIQRWFPRRKSYVVASNFGENKISADLSLLLYTGKVIVGPRADSVSESISFKEVNLWPGESVVIMLD